jgi:hypothetical protein
LQIKQQNFTISFSHRFGYLKVPDFLTTPSRKPLFNRIKTTNICSEIFVFQRWKQKEKNQKIKRNLILKKKASERNNANQIIALAPNYWKRILHYRCDNK